MTTATVTPIIPSNRHIETLSVDLPIYDPRVQRKEGTDQRRVAQMAEAFNSAALGVGNLSRRADGSLVIIDSAHRIAVCKLVGHSKMTFVVHEGLTLRQEAALFLLLNTFRAPTAISKFLARVVKGDPDACDIFAMIEAHGWHIAQSDDPGCITAVDALQRIYGNAAGTLPPGAHHDLVDWTLGVITAAWGHDPHGVNNAILLGLAHLHARFGTAVQRQKLVHELRLTNPTALVGRAKTIREAQGGTMPAAMGRVLTGLHNNKLRSSRLPEWVWTR